MSMLLAQSAPAMSEAPLIWGIILVGTAIVLLFLELFVPSGGILSLCSAVAVLASILAFFTGGGDPVVPLAESRELMRVLAACRTDAEGR